MPLSQETQELLDIALEKAADEGFNLAGFYMSSNPPEFVHFSVPTRSRSQMAQMVQTWLELLQDQAVSTEVVQGPQIYLA